MCWHTYPYFVGRYVFSNYTTCTNNYIIPYRYRFCDYCICTYENIITYFYLAKFICMRITIWFYVMSQYNAPHSYVTTISNFDILRVKTIKNNLLSYKRASTLHPPLVSRGTVFLSLEDNWTLIFLKAKLL